MDGTQSGKIGRPEGTLTFSGGLNNPGLWFARFLLNDGYAELTNISFNVVAADTPLARPNKRLFASGEATPLNVDPKLKAKFYRARQ